MSSIPLRNKARMTFTTAQLLARLMIHPATSIYNLDTCPPPGQALLRPAPGTHHRIQRAPVAALHNYYSCRDQRDTYDTAMMLFGSVSSYITALNALIQVLHSTLYYWWIFLLYTR
jgi:hypothetical protein